MTRSIAPILQLHAEKSNGIRTENLDAFVFIYRSVIGSIDAAILLNDKEDLHVQHC
ncbi:hypothetical protein [Anaerocolumna jejuensis]|uniref:hypothetical protein n=1 Tax=Anaerocolumna jejuensis TaxID=259063 RepID=UPI003F7BC98E